MGKSRTQAAGSPEATQDAPAPDLDTPTPEPTTEEGSGEIVNDSRGATLEVDEGNTVEEAIASPVGGSDQYPYLDQTRVPHHERNMPNMGNSPLTEASQAELNPAFTAKAEDGGPTNENGDSIGTEPNADEKLVIAAQNLENQGANAEGTVAEVEQQIEDQKDQQIDAEQVQADFAEANPDKDPVTGQDK